jgi:predicted nucleic acid-binding protein
VKIIEDDPDDNRILECALEAGADLIISGDHHLLELKQIQKVKILSPSDFLKEI